MSKLKKEAVGQYNYVAPTPSHERVTRKQPRHSYPDFYPHTDVTVEIIDPNSFKLSNIKPPNIFDTSYFSDYRHPPAENFMPFNSKDNLKDTNYTAYVQTSLKGRIDEKQTSSKTEKSFSKDETKKYERNFIKSAGAENVRPPPGVARAKTAEPAQRITKQDKINAEFRRALLKARSGSEWKKTQDVSYDVMNPEKPTLKRDTKPYGAQMENEQEKIAHIEGDGKKRRRPPSTAAGGESSKKEKSVESQMPTAVVSPSMLNKYGTGGQFESKSVSRASSASGRSSAGIYDNQRRPFTAGSSITSIGDDYLLETGRHLNEALETIQEEEILDQLAPPTPVNQKPRTSNQRRRRGLKLKKPLPPTDLFSKKGPDPRFYASKKNLRTPNEMERFRKARGRAFMRNVEQAIPELDLRDHEVKHQPERQLLQDARWRIRRDVKDVRDKNLHSLVDRFEERHKIIKDETRTRLGDPTYIGRDPVSVYKLHDVTNNYTGTQPKLGFQVQYPLHGRRRVTPSLGSVQRARNLGSHAQIFNQACAPPHWAPQKVDHSLFLPRMTQGI